MNISPVAFLVVAKGNVKLLPVSPPAGSTVDRVVEMVPGIVDKISEMLGKEHKQEPEENNYKTSKSDSPEE